LIHYTQECKTLKPAISGFKEELKEQLLNLYKTYDRLKDYPSLQKTQLSLLFHTFQQYPEQKGALN